jgi:hypothetical protein
MIELFAVAVAIAISVPGIVLAVRALPPVAVLVERGVKPWACDVCSCFWITALLVVCAMQYRFELALTAPPAYTLSMLLLSFMQRPTALPPPPE